MELLSAKELLKKEFSSSRVSIDDDGVMIDESYFIEFSRINTTEKLLGWVHHLTEKNWITQFMIHDLVEKVTQKIGMNIHNL